MLSLIIPTYNERENVERMIPEIDSVLKNIKHEIIVVDDNSPDRTAEAALRLGNRYNVKVIRRAGKLGLSSAVVEGFQMATGNFLGVMDADFSHPLEKLPEMYNLLKTYDMVVGSRYVKGGDIENWPLKRRVISRGATLLALPVTRLKDPMSGFFMIRRDVLGGAKLNTRGYKICLEVYAKGRPRRVKEIPYIFRDREAGSSKMNRKEIVNYFLHVLSLYGHSIRK
ncbi:MAG: polyprenol monophosphomannose synthase [Candidatus Aenigmatarchaeota archaeon]